MDTTTGQAAMVAAAGDIWQEPCGAEEGSIGPSSPPCPREVNKTSHFRAGAAKFTDDQMGQPMLQKEPGTCVLVACTVCVGAVHRLQHQKLHGKGSTFPYIALEPCVSDLLEACRIDGVWKPKVGARVRDVLIEILVMGGVTAINAASKEKHFLPLVSCQEYIMWENYDQDYWHQHQKLHGKEVSAASRISPELVADLLDNYGPFIGLLWVSSPWYDRVDADCNDALVYTSGFGPSDDDARRKIEEDPEANAGWHAVVCFGYQSRDGKMDVLVLDNHTSTGPRRWIDSEEFCALYTLSV